MKGALMIRRIGGSVVVAAALAAAAAAPASAMIGPACSTRVAPPATAPTASCSFDSNTDWAYVAVETVGSVKATVRCFTTWGGTVTRERTFTETATWYVSTPGSCSLSLTADVSTLAANGSASPALPPIYTH
jgi:hypothetical protein